MNSRRLTATALSLFMTAGALEATPARAEDGESAAPPLVLGPLVVTGDSERARQVGGSATYLGPEELEKFSYDDVNRVLRQVPGVYIQEEEGFGLRPNIGIRGSGNDRSAKIALMEDGVLIAPAPYAASSAYYFPSIARMSAVEVVKGAGAIKYGPHTVGGAFNMFSTPIPESAGGISGRAQLAAGEHGTLRAHGFAGGYVPVGAYDFGFLLETLQDRSDGFKQIDIGGDTGFRVGDYVGKLALRSNAAATVTQSLELKFQYSDQTSDETYLGLTLPDFAANPYRRYNASQLDQMKVEHRTYQATHHIELGNGFDLTTLAYYTHTARAWYKLQSANGRSLSAVLADPTAAANVAAFQSILGAPGFVSADNALVVRNNNRKYYAAGVQALLSKTFGLGATQHDLELSVRYHRDEEDRFQNDDRFRMDNGRMVLTTAGAPGSQDNRVGEAEAWAFFVQDRIEWGDLAVTPGLRYETIELTQTRWSTADPGRTAPTSVASDTVDVFIPGISATWQVTEAIQLLAGVHRGFTNPSPGSTAEPERSVNYEAGLRYGQGPFSAELIGFFNDYRNIVGTCTASTGGGCTIGDQFDGGEAEIKGVEFALGYDAGSALGLGLQVPLQVVYTYTDAKFQTSFVSAFEPWGSVQVGDELPYVPEHQLTLNAGVAGERWRVDLTVNYVTEARASAGQGDIPVSDRIDARTVLDLAGEYDVTENAALFVRAENVTDAVYNVALAPSGARPGKPRTVLGGVKISF